MLESPIPRSRSEPPQPLLRPRRLQRRQPRLLRRDQEQLELIGADAEAITVRDHDVIVVVALLGPAVPAQERIFAVGIDARSEEHTSELQSLMRISYAVFCLKKKTKQYQQ